MIFLVHRWKFGIRIGGRENSHSKGQSLCTQWHFAVVRKEGIRTNFERPLKGFFQALTINGASSQF
jgi:hypothetical protein